MKILAAVDGSSYTKRMLAYLMAHDEWLGGMHEYTVLHVVTPVPPRAAATIDRAALKSYYDSTSEGVFKPIRTFFARHKMKPVFAAKVGPTAETIAELASKGGFDLLIMGSHGRDSLVNLVMGSVATRVLAHCRTPVLLIR